MAAGWKPPKFGSPVWVDIASTDVSRAHKFYATVFNWSFTDRASNDKEPREDFQKFDFNPDVNLSGCVRRVPEASVLVPGRGGICLYWFVEDVDKTGELIENAGGKMLGGTEKEGESGLYRFFEDTEGNLGAVYQVKM